MQPNAGTHPSAQRLPGSRISETPAHVSHTSRRTAGSSLKLRRRYGRPVCPGEERPAIPSAGRAPAWVAGHSHQQLRSALATSQRITPVLGMHRSHPCRQRGSKVSRAGFLGAAPELRGPSSSPSKLPVPFSGHKSQHKRRPSAEAKAGPPAAVPTDARNPPECAVARERPRSIILSSAHPLLDSSAPRRRNACGWVGVVAPPLRASRPPEFERRFLRIFLLETFFPVLSFPPSPFASAPCAAVPRPRSRDDACLRATPPIMAANRIARTR